MPKPFELVYPDPPYSGSKKISLENAVQSGLRDYLGEAFDIHQKPDGSLVAVARYANPQKGDKPVFTVTAAAYFGARQWEVHRLFENGEERGPFVYRVHSNERWVQ